MSQPQQGETKVRTGRDTSFLSLLVAVVVGGAAVISSAAPHLPEELVSLRGLIARPWLFGGLVALVGLPVAVSMGFDFAAAQRRTYEPPAVRVQVSRSLVYGAGLLVTLGAAVLCLHPTGLLTLAASDSIGAWSCALGMPLAVSAWVLCFRPRRFIVAAPPSWREAASVLQDTNDFLLGWQSEDWKRGPLHGGGDRRWFVLPEYGLFANAYCLGGIGSGKTFTVIKPMLEQALYKWAGDRVVEYAGEKVSTRDMRVGIFLLDYKGNNAAYVLERAKALGRSADVMVITPGGEWSINPLSNGTPQQVAQKLVAALEVMTSQQSNSYYRKMQLEFANHAMAVLQDVLGPGKATLRDLYDFTTDPACQSKFLEAAKPKASLSWRWFETQWKQEDPSEQMMLTKGFRADLSQFVTPELAPTFCRSDSNFPGWRSLPNDGKIVVYSMNVDEWGPVARALGIFMLMDFQLQMLARTTTRFKETGGNTRRLVMCFADEVWAYMNPGLAEFTAVSREARCCTLAAHQSIDQVPLQYRATMVGNFRTPIILGINDPLSCETFSKVFGTHKVVRRSRSESAGYAGVSHGVLSETVIAKAGGESRSVSYSESEVDEPRFSPDELTRLPKFHAVVQVFDGAIVRPPVVVQLVPGHEALLA
ncbi:TraM recognition domain-containing protein (plasmid) [Myxococcus stipitatus]|uniref:type IV secretory system conjugative DNA transfer family protein n=1 Tax=Myxococcus stipitatus TaxID=83455 RepID=UPI00314509EE